MLQFKEAIRDFHVSINELYFGDTFKYNNKYFIAMDDGMAGNSIPCFDLLNYQIIEFNGSELVTIIEVNCNIKDRTKDCCMKVEELLYCGETFKYHDEYFIVIEDDDGIYGNIPCFSLLNNRVVEFDGDELVTTVEIECIIKEG